MSDTNRAPVVPPRKVTELRNDPYAGQSGDLSLENAIRSIGRGAVFVGPYTDELTAGTDAGVGAVCRPPTTRQISDAGPNIGRAV
jgi:hypothetical protein